eukprot:359919-Chlamydomonas_euryale.AAC.11
MILSSGRRPTPPSSSDARPASQPPLPLSPGTCAPSALSAPLRPPSPGAETRAAPGPELGARDGERRPLAPFASEPKPLGPPLPTSMGPLKCCMRGGGDGSGGSEGTGRCCCAGATSLRRPCSFPCPTDVHPQVVRLPPTPLDFSGWVRNPVGGTDQHCPRRET